MRDHNVDRTSRRKKTRRSAGENDAGEQGSDGSFAGGVSQDGRLVLFWSRATNLVPSDWNGQPDIFMGDLDFAYTLPAANWTAKLKKGTVAGWTYKDAKRLAGPIGSIVQPGSRSSSKARAPTWYCGLFGGTTSFKPGTQFKATKAPAPAGCDE